MAVNLNQNQMKLKEYVLVDESNPYTDLIDRYKEGINGFRISPFNDENLVEIVNFSFVLFFFCNIILIMSQQSRRAERIVL